MVLTEVLVHGIPVITSHPGDPFTIPSSIGLFATEGKVENLKLVIEELLLNSNL